MNRFQRAAVILALLDALKERGSWCGETHLQKAIYFLQEMCGVPMGFKHVLYRFGPYSFDFSDEITALRADRLLDLEVKAPYGPSIIRGENATRFLESFGAPARKYAPQVSFVAEHLGRSTVVELERLATAFFVTREATLVADDEQRAARLNQLKSHIPIESARQAVREVDAMRAAASAALT